MSTNSRGTWGSELQFILACVGYSVGLGNLWRFPAKAYENGGAAFLIPYVCCSLLVGLPCLYLELLIGQLTQSGPSKAFTKFTPLLQGLGWSMSAMSFLTGLFYNMVVAWCLRYMFDIVTIQSSKWISCDNYWNTDGGTFNWEIFLAYVFAWIITGIILLKGVAVIGKASFVTATLPYVLIVILLIRGVTMDGAHRGIDFYLLKPDMHKLFSVKTWLEAAKQLCFSLSIGFGGLLSLASFNKKDHNCFRLIYGIRTFLAKDALIIVTCDGLMSIIGGVAVFSALGALSKSSGKDIGEFLESGGTTATFITYPQAIGDMPADFLLSFMLFAMFFLLGISSQFGLTQSVVTTVTDEFPMLRKHSEKVVVFFCNLSVLIGLIMCWQGLVVMGIAEESSYSTNDRAYSGYKFVAPLRWLLEYLPLITIPIFAVVNIRRSKVNGKSWREVFRIRPQSWASDKVWPADKVSIFYYKVKAAVRSA
ncbi:unnamed protein product [Nippostrongylus brasiliensis]|uniref:Transporter n=1 Tax=Nippostrongylus brasiliensis TaxID=27835 RepID=A0A0N4YJL7_NIPBR|nr:unnamed protein product [Nippostrongylus brasiliensis]